MEVESSLSLEFPQLCRQLTFSEIMLATQNFDESLVIGRGGFGMVYKGTITNGATLLNVAIKRLDSTSNQGPPEFWAEVKMLSKIRHCHLVSLIGYCNDEQEMILVYEYMPNGTLEDHLHKLRTHIPWVRRLKICIGYARGLDYLHTGTGIRQGIIHRDVKSSNMLLDNNWAAKISDFGLSKIGPTNQPSTYVNTFVKGTFGYLDPDYFSTGRLTRKSDVYAFGVVLLEVLCRKRAVDSSLDEEQWGLASWARDSIKEGRLKQIVDTNIRGTISPTCLKKFARLADGCLHNHPKQRPTMAEVVVNLQSILVLQEKNDSALTTPGMTLFGRKMPMFLFPSNRENSDVVGDRDLKSLELYLHNVGGESKVLYRFDFETISVATANFSEANKIPQSQFSSMYKGKLNDGQGIAIAQLYSNSECQRYINEVSLLVKLQHENLAQLLGYCVQATKLFIVYKFAPYASLDHLIFDPNSAVMDWNNRYIILLGVARVLLYLHKHAPIQIIHANVTPSNILLDESLDPKLLNFELAVAINETDCIDVQIVCGTREYLAPEYLNGRLSTKADVYSFGMLILKTISGRNGSLGVDNTFVQYAWRNWWEGTCSSIVDPRIDADSSSLRRFIHIGLLCVQTDAANRPTMEDVVRMLLASSFLDLPIPKNPQIIQEDLDHTNTQGIYNSGSVGEFVIEEDLDHSHTEEIYDSGTVEEFISELHPR